MPELILASGSRFRRDMLERAGVSFRVQVADVDEPAIRDAMLRADPRVSGAVIAMTLAEAKARQVSALAPDAWVIGSDQVLACDGALFSKPPTIPAAAAQLRALRGRTHTLPTAVVLMRDETVHWRHVSEPRLTMRAFSDDFLRAYLDAVGEEACTTVGGYKLEGLGGQLFKTIEGDYFSIIGLPLLPLLGALREVGVLPS